MDSIQTLTDRLAIYLAAYKHYLDVKSHARLLDSAIFGEPLAMDLATIAFGYKDLTNLNIDGNHPAIDLGSETAGCAIQVTLMASSTKVVETQRKFFEHGLDKTYTRLKFICLRGRQSEYASQQIVRERGSFRFDPKQDIYDLKDLLKRLVDHPDPEKLKLFSGRLEAELSSAIRPYLLGIDRPGQNLRRLFEDHDVRTSDAVKALGRFNVSRAVFSDSTRLAEAASPDLTRYVAEQFWISDDWIDGVDDHIYSGGPGNETTTSWRRTLRDAYELIERVSSNEEQLRLIIPSGLSLCDLDAMEDVVDQRALSYENFYLVAQKQNDFLVDSFRMVVGDALRYEGCRQGILLLFLAAAIFQIETQRPMYLNVIAVPREVLLGCLRGEQFLAEVSRSGTTIDNHTDYFYHDDTGALIATPKVPHRLAKFLQDQLSDFVAGRFATLPTTIRFS